MKKPVKILLWVIGTVVVLVIALFMSADIIASRLVQKEVSKAFDKIPNADASIGKVYLNLISGSAIVSDILFTTNSLQLKDSESGERAPGMAVSIPSVAIWNIRYLELLRAHRVNVLKISVNEPKILVYLDEKNPESIVPFFPKDTMLDKAVEWLESIEVHGLEINNLSGRLVSTRSPLHIQVDSLSLKTPAMAFSLFDSLFTYNDSVYAVDVKAFRVETPDGLFAIETHDLRTRNQGPLELGYTRIKNSITAKQMADLKREPVSWIDIELNKLRTSALNPIRKGLAADYHLDSLKADVKRMHVITDERHKPRRPFGTPHDFLRHVPVSFGIKHVEALARKVDVELLTTDINRGEMHLKNMRAQMTNVTNRAGAVWTSHATGPFGDKGKVDATFVMHLNRAAAFNVKIDVRDVDTEQLNPFIRPLIGITSQCHINHLEARYKGDRSKAEGQFCMQYRGLDVQVHKEDKIPYEVVTKNADFFTSLANTLVPKSNPTSVDPAPRRYMVEWKRDEWKPYPLYIFGPCIDGVKKTMLPGLYVHKQAK